MDDLLEYLIHMQPGLGGNLRCIRGLNADHVLDLLDNTFRFRTWQIHLIDNRENVQIVIQRQIDVGKSLCLHTLSRIHHKDRPVAGRKTSGHFIIKVHMSRCVDQIENIFFPILCLIDGTNRLRFDCDASLPLQLHIIKNLGLHLPACQKSGLLNDPVRQSRFPVINMCNDAEIPYMFLINN